MTRRQRLTDEGVAKLKPKAKRYTFADPELPGHYVRVSPSGDKSFVVVARDNTGKQIWRATGPVGLVMIDDARDAARKFIRGLRDASPNSFKGVAANWFARHVIKNQLRSADVIRRVLNAQINPVLGERDFASIRRSDIARLLDGIEDNSGPRAADYALTIIRQICTWHATRDDNYQSPIVRGMSRGERKSRERILTDDEIRAIWSVTGESSFGRLVRFALLTAQRKEKLASMKWSDLEGNVWKIATEDREKGHGGELMLPDLALEVLGERGEGFVFPTQQGNRHSSWSTHKKILDKRSGVSGWCLHDLRRTARSLMSRAGVQPHIAELTLGHVQQGVQAVYDRHQYVSEKGDALAKLAGLLGLILAPSDNVVNIKRHTA